MEGAKIFFSHMVKARIFFFAKTRARIFFSKKTQAPPWESNGRDCGQISKWSFWIIQDQIKVPNKGIEYTFHDFFTIFSMHNAHPNYVSIIHEYAMAISKRCSP